MKMNKIILLAAVAEGRTLRGYQLVSPQAQCLPQPYLYSYRGTK